MSPDCHRCQHPRTRHTANGGICTQSPCLCTRYCSPRNAAGYAYDPGYTGHLDADYTLLVRAFGDDGTAAPRDDFKSMCQWNLDTPHGKVEIFDDKVGRCYRPQDGLERHEITEWSVLGSDEAVQHMLILLDTVATSPQNGE